MIKIVDYGLGNIAAFLNMYKRMNIPAAAVSTAAELADAERIILPGVGAFDHAMELLNASGMRETLEEKVAGGTPLLGVCVGMQILTDASDEGVGPGLGWIPGRTRAIASRNDREPMPLPHMGWNDVVPAADKHLFDGIDDNLRFYFLHSFYVDCEPEYRAATTDYGMDFACAINRGNVWGVQFHPEKSHHFGAGLLKNFAVQ